MAKALVTETNSSGHETKRLARSFFYKKKIDTQKHTLGEWDQRAKPRKRTNTHTHTHTQ